jgi:hypothetical protein
MLSERILENDYAPIIQRIAFTPFHRNRKGNTRGLRLRPTEFIFGGEVAYSREQQKE